MEVGGTQEHLQRAEWKTHIGVNEDRPNTTEGNQASECRDGEPQREHGKVHKGHSVDCIEGVFAVRGKPVEVLRTVMHGMESPQEAHPVLKAMAPVNQPITQYHDFDCLEPPRLRSDGAANCPRDNPVDHISRRPQAPEHQPIPDHDLTPVEAQIEEPLRTKEPLRQLGRETHFQWVEHNKQEAQVHPCEQEWVKAH